MDYEINYDVTNALFIIKIIGGFELAKFESLCSDLIAAPLWRAGSNCIFDYREASLTHMSRNDLYGKISVLLSHKDGLGNGKMAMIAKDQLNFGMSRMFQLMAESNMVGLDIGVFYDVPSTEAWIKNDQSVKDPSLD